jgi:hypothetical protein
MMVLKVSWCGISTGLRVHRRLRQQDRVLLRRGAQLVVEGVVPRCGR